MSYDEVTLDHPALTTGRVNLFIQGDDGFFDSTPIQTFAGSSTAYVFNSAFGNYFLGTLLGGDPDVLALTFGADILVHILASVTQDGEPPTVAPGGAMSYTPGDFDRNHIGLTFGGLLPQGEIWVCSLKLANDSTGLVGDLADPILDAIVLKDYMDSSVAAAVQTFFTAGATGISYSAWLTFAKLSRYGRDGKLRSSDPGEVYEHVYPSGTVGAVSNTPYPNQIALAVTMTTGFSRGAGHKGRFYLPLPTFPMDGGIISVGSAQGLADTTKTFINALSDFPGLNIPGAPTVSVMSRKSGAAVTRKVTGVSVGRAYDTIRRRRNAVSENYVNDSL